MIPLIPTRRIALLLATLFLLPLGLTAASAQQGGWNDTSPEPRSEHPGWSPPPMPPRVSLRLEPDELRVEPGQRALATYRVTNDGDAFATVRVSARSMPGDLDAHVAGHGLHHLAPGESATGTVAVASAGASRAPFGIVHVEAAVEGEDGMGFTSLAFLRVHAPLREADRAWPAPPEPARHSCAEKAWRFPFLLRFAARPACVRVVPAPEPIVFQPLRMQPLVVPTPEFVVLEPQPMRHHEFAARCEPAPHPAREDALLFRLAVNGRFEGDRLVIELDEEMRARVAKLMEQHRAEAGWGTSHREAS